MSKAATQTERVVKAARSSRGVCRIDFQLPDVIDGGDPILNFPGRMYDAERAGYSFEVIGKRNRCKVFRLIEDGIERTVGLSDATRKQERNVLGAATGYSSDEDEGSRKAPVRSGDAGLMSRASAGGSLSAEPTLFDLPVPGPVSPYEEAA